MKKREVLYTTKEVLHYIHSVINDCAAIVCPEPHVEEERNCEQVAEQIRALKTRWKSTGYVLRTTSDENLWKRKYVLLDKENRTAEENKELAKLNRKIMALRTNNDPETVQNMKFVKKAFTLLSKKSKKILKANDMHV